MFRGVACWRGADAPQAVCGICRGSFDATCASCTRPGDSCPPVFLQCSHCLHLHCLEAWLKESNACPLCRAEVEFTA